MCAGRVSDRFGALVNVRTINEELQDQMIVTVVVPELRFARRRRGRQRMPDVVITELCEHPEVGVGDSQYLILQREPGEDGLGIEFRPVSEQLKDESFPPDQRIIRFGAGPLDAFRPFALERFDGCGGVLRPSSDQRKPSTTPAIGFNP